MCKEALISTLIIWLLLFFITLLLPFALDIALALVGMGTIVRHMTIFTTYIASYFVHLPCLDELVVLGRIIEPFIPKH